MVDLVPVSSLQVHGHVTAEGMCLGASHALSVHTHSLFQGLSAYKPSWKGKLGFVRQFRAIGFLSED